MEPLPTTSPTTQPVASADVTDSNPGAWGKLQLVPIVLEVPDEYIAGSTALTSHDIFTFTNQTQAQALDMMKGCGLTSEQLDMARAAPWTMIGSNAIFQPDDRLLLSLSPEARTALYNKLMADPVNQGAIDPYWFRPGRVEFRLRGTDLKPETLALFDKLLYAGPNDLLLFNDIKPAMRAIEDPVERTSSPRPSRASDR
ncbi:MAG: hypothetical protein QM770_04470 [Tepidisphaeraceae bacterium]